jgi:hypothetical protein
MATIRTFNKQGKAVPFSRGSTPSPLGRVIDGRVYQKPRAKLNPLAASGNVKVTNPAYAKLGQRTASLGMGRVGQIGRYTDL